MVKILSGIIGVLVLAVLGLVVSRERTQLRGGPEPEVKAVVPHKVEGGKDPTPAQAATAAASPPATDASGIDALLSQGDPDLVERKVVFVAARAVGKEKQVILLKAHGDATPYVCFDKSLFPAGFARGKEYTVLCKPNTYRGRAQMVIEKFKN